MVSGDKWKMSQFWHWEATREIRSSVSLLPQMIVFRGPGKGLPELIPGGGALRHAARHPTQVHLE